MNSRTILYERISRATLIGLLIPTLCFLLLALLPEPFFRGLITDFFPSTQGGIFQLDLQDFSHEVEDNQFHIFVHVQNISKLPLEKVQAVVSVITGADNQRTIVYPVSTSAIVPSQTITFDVTFTDVPRVARYTILFQDETGRPIPHTRGTRLW
ncbi:MAG: hypothetical protein JXQ27_09715 [Acidobacteria bacterium]|nr:hypothetical protein [Acidobacteriota bacterium]